uniref:SET domain-containing protein n=1 Tax=Coccolithus braarudii TaxID=221442 RepID=A0A7S0LLX3_9EUKA|mmetsp:Transcript_4769/g.10429  ORF Transcript_4769/g.10429 Transcript_4769/m.10429 type:complete len:285 (+) Transcript_4769:27-881(+)
MGASRLCVGALWLCMLPTLRANTLPPVARVHVRHQLIRTKPVFSLRAGKMHAVHMDGNELDVHIKDAGNKGRGAFAAVPCATGRWVCTYIGQLISLEQTQTLYTDREPEYLFDVGNGCYLDAQDSTHFSRYFNHEQNGTLNFTVDKDAQAVNFFAARDIEVGEELTFDYGPGYWVAMRKAPADGTDTRSFELPHANTRPVGPPPLVPRTMNQLSEAAALPAADARLCMLRGLEFFGACRLPSGDVEVPFGLGPNAARQSVQPELVDVTLLHEALARCIADRVPG